MDPRPSDPRRLEARVRVLKALAHPSRLIMLEALAEGDRCVCELQELVGADMSTVSKHLALMRSAGLVADRKEGLKVFYSLRAPCVLEFFSCIEDLVDIGSTASCGARRACLR